MAVAVGKWDVFLVKNCKHTTPKPKDKYVVIVSVGDGYEGFFINSFPPRAITHDPRLHPCVAPISAEENGFLSHSSYVACDVLYLFEAGELTNKLGSLSLSSRDRVKRASQKCRKLERKEKIKINDDT